jgi:hypothetical protein
MPDPTLLLPKEEYERLIAAGDAAGDAAGSGKQNSPHGIFAYR